MKLRLPKWPRIIKINKRLILNSFLILAILFSFIILLLTYPFDNSQPTKLEFISGYEDVARNVIQVDIGGAVKKPGIYAFNDETRVASLIEQAGGLHKEADLGFVSQSINLSKKLSDQDKIFIPFRSTSNLPAQPNSAGSKININSATAAQLMELPGVGESTAQKILAARPFSKVEDLLDVPGIGDAKFAQLKDFITI